MASFGVYQHQSPNLLTTNPRQDIWEPLHVHTWVSCSSTRFSPCWCCSSPGPQTTSSGPLSQLLLLVYSGGYCFPGRGHLPVVLQLPQGALPPAFPETPFLTEEQVWPSLQPCYPCHLSPNIALCTSQRYFIAQTMFAAHWVHFHFNDCVSKPLFLWGWGHVTSSDHWFKRGNDICATSGPNHQRGAVSSAWPLFPFQGWGRRCSRGTANASKLHSQATVCQHGEIVRDKPFRAITLKFSPIAR